jgi:hypothetical protein
MAMRVEYYQYVKDTKVGYEGRIATWKYMISKYGERIEWNYNIADCYQKSDNTSAAKTYLKKAKGLAGNSDTWTKKIQDLETKISK